MNKRLIDIQISNLVDALVRNINDNFINISFDIKKDGYIQVRIILEECTETEKEYIEDISGEFEASQNADIVEEFEIILDKNIPPLQYVVLSKKLE